MKRLCTLMVWCVVLAASALWVAACGCSYANASDVVVTPPVACLQTAQLTGCATLEFDVTNSCTETLTLSKDGDTQSVAPGETATIAPDRFGEMDIVGDSCTTRAVIPAMLGSDLVEFEFTYERVNRGAGGC
jgi:hypothetical protein